MTNSPDEIISIALSPDEWLLLRCGLNEWGGPARCTDEMAVAMGFENRKHMLRDIYDRLLPMLDAQNPMSRLDWLRVLLATEIVFASGILGSGSDWPITTGIPDADTIMMLRDLERTIGSEVRHLVGNGFGTRPRPDPRWAHHNEDGRLTIDCAKHGRRQPPAVVCQHHIARDHHRPIGFVENSSAATDLQAWCEDCEARFVEEGGMTDAFKQFNGMSVVCVACYERIRERHLPVES